MSNDPWVVALKDKSLPELEMEQGHYEDYLKGYTKLKMTRELNTEENQDFLTKSYRSAMIWNEMRERA